ncbi:MAG: HNH endonuclease [Gammaproteobacteria bacterium]|nr:HNH endonuclease [Gammaproteobacteria bacterium]
MSANQPVVSLKDHRAEQLGSEITELYGYITAATYELLLKIREFDAAGLWEGPGLTSCAHWLNWQCGIGMNAAREKVRVARALGDLPKISEAFRNGEVSYSKVRAITRVANVGNEDFLLMTAKHGTAHHVETLVRGYRRAERLDNPNVAERQYQSRSFNYHWDNDGSLVFNGRLPAEVGAMLMKALQSSIDHQDKEVTAVTPPDSDCEPARHCEHSKTVSQRRADAVAEIAESYLKNGPASSSSADRYQVMIHVAAEISDHKKPLHCEEQSDEADAMTGALEDGPHVTAETSRRICCDTSISRVVKAESGETLSIGRKSRVIPPAMRRALKARDKNCRFPGCTHRHFIDGHHIKHWTDGGETSIDNLVQLCRHHHRLVHEGGFACEKNEAGEIAFRDRDGLPIPVSGQVPGFRGNVIADFENLLEDRHIDSQSCVPDWHGETMDRDLAVGMLWDINHREALPR